jgi:hypothetical protein
MRIFFLPIIFLSLLLSIESSAFIPKALLVLQKTAENNGTGAYIIEQEVQFPTSQEPLVLKETWVVENENSMKLTVTGTKELKDQFKMQFVYAGGVRTSFIGTARQSRRIGDDFIEKYFHIRTGESFANHFIQMKITPAAILLKKIGKTSKDFDNTTESFIRLSRVGGVVSYGLGVPAAPEGSDASAGFWIEQDQFVLRKFRLPSGVEVSAEKYSQFSRGLNFPRKRTVRWENNTVQIQTLSVSGKAGRSLGTLEPSQVESLETLSVKNLVQDFYNRYR